MIENHSKTQGTNVLMILILSALLFINLHKSLKTMTVTKSSSTTTLYFSSITNPLDTLNVLAPQDGTVAAIYKPYGSYVKKNDYLFNIKSTSMENEFRQSIEGYLKAKANYQKALFNYQGNSELFKLGLISKQTFMDQESQLKDSEYAQLDAELQLKKALMSMGVSFENIQKLSLNDIDKVKQIFRESLGGAKIQAEQDGLLLFSSKTLGTAGEQSGPLKVGSKVSAGSAMAVIANMNGLILQIKIMQTNFHDVHVGDPATVTSPAFEGISLDGVVFSIDRQAQGEDFNSIPSYSAYIKVPHLSQKARDIIQTGMTAQVALDKKTPPVISIPIDAVITNNEGYFVKVLDPKTQKIRETPVTTGVTDGTSVEIVQGLSEGETIVLPD